MAREPVPRNVNPEVARRSARLAGLVRVGADPDRITEARRDLKAAGLSAHIARDVDSWPELTPAQRAELAVQLLSPATP